MIILRILFTALIWCGLSTKSIGSQELISGSNLADLVTQRLNKEGLSAQPVIKKERVFYGCGSDNIIISKRDKSWKTVKLTCKNNKLWNYSFRNKIAEPVSSEQYIDLQKISKDSTPKNTKKVFVLRHSKFKGDKIEKSDLVLSEKKKMDHDRDGDNDFADVMMQRMKKSGMDHEEALKKTRKQQTKT